MANEQKTIDSKLSFRTISVKPPFGGDDQQYIDVGDLINILQIVMIYPDSKVKSLLLNFRDQLAKKSGFSKD